MGKRVFYRQWLRMSFSQSVNKGDFFSSVAGGVVTVVTHYLDPDSAKSLAAAMALRIVVAPYELWSEQKQKADAVPPEAQPFDIGIWEDVEEFALYQAACLWVSSPPPATADGRMPDRAVLILHRLKRALRKVAEANRQELFAEGNGWVQAFLMLSMGAPGEEIENSLVISRSGLEACANVMNDYPSFLFEEEA